MTQALSRPILCMVTDRRRVMPLSGDPGGATADAEAARLERLLTLAAQASSAGVQLVQVREPDLDDRQLLAFTRRLVAVTGPGTRIVVNDRLDVALAAGAAGVHLRGDSFSATRIRGVVPNGFLIGRSVHDADEAREAAGTGVDYLIMGTVRPTPSKAAGAPIAGLHGLESACRAAPLPVLAIGGIAADNLRDIAAAGAAGVAAIGLFVDAARTGSGGLRAVVNAAVRAFASVKDGD